MKKLLPALAIVAIFVAIACKKTDSTKPGTRYELTNSSIAKWKGFLRTGYFNEGSIEVKSGNIVIADGLVKSGTFEMPLAGIQNFNLPHDTLKEQLIHHLQSPDFFNMVLHPSVTFELKKVKHYSGKDPDAVEGANFTVTGMLTILGKPLEISFPANISIKDDSLKVKAKTTIDRTKWGMSFAADESLPDDKYILPAIALELDMKGIKK